MSLILLRHQPGVELFEYRFAEKGAWTEAFEDWANEIAEELFGISEHDIDSSLEQHFTPKLRMMRDESDAYWAQHGWDVTDGNGKELRIMDVLTRPMVCMVEHLHPDARFRASTEAWGEALQADAQRFKRDP